MNYEEALKFIHNERWLGPKRPLSDTRRMLDDLGAPDRKMKIIHVAGTNGKGSVCAFMESILRKSGYKTGMFTSPYITRFNERIKVNGEDIPDDELAELVDELSKYIEKSGIKPKEFEIVTVLGFMYFAKQHCDAAVVEVGLGGANDYTNVIDTPDAAVITAIGLDHTKQLGSTLPEIAGAKAGIIKPDGDVIVYGGEPQVNEVFVSRCQKVGARLTFTPMKDVQLISAGLDGCTFNFGRFKKLFVPLAGLYQPYNAATAVTAADVLAAKGFNITDESIREGLAAAVWKGRFEVLMREPVFILDGAHNPPAIEAAAQSLTAVLPGRKIVFVTGVMADKDVGGIVDILVPLARCFVTIPIDYPRAMSAESYRELLVSHGGEAVAASSVYEGVCRAIELAGQDGAVCALGSLYLSQPVREAAEKYISEVRKNNIGIGKI